jgi:transposase
MLIQQIASVAKTEFASIFVALELSRSKWLVGVGTPQRWTVRRHEVQGGDLDGLLELLRRISAGEEKRTGLPARVHACFEAGRDGHWLHRALTSAGYDVYEIDPASVAVDRRARPAPSRTAWTSRKLARTLARLLRGELDACRVVAVPSEAEEDAKRPHREYERLVKEQTAHRNRLKALLFAQGVRDFDPMASDRLERLATLPIMPRLKAELARECRRLAGIIDAIAEVEAEMKAAIVPRSKAEPQTRPRRRRAMCRPRSPSSTSSRASASISARCSRARSIIGHSTTGAASGNISAWRRLPFRAATWLATRGSPRPATAGRAKR